MEQRLHEMPWEFKLYHSKLSNEVSELFHCNFLLHLAKLFDPIQIPLDLLALLRVVGQFSQPIAIHGLTLYGHRYSDILSELKLLNVRAIGEASA